MFTSLIFLRHQPNRLSSRSECHCANHSDSWSNCYIDSAHTKPNASESNKLSVCTAWLSIYASFIFYASASSDSGSLCGCVPEKNGIQNHQIGRSAVLSVCVAYMSQCSCGHSLKLFVFGVVRCGSGSAQLSSYLNERENNANEIGKVIELPSQTSKGFCHFSASHRHTKIGHFFILSIHRRKINCGRFNERKQLPSK